MREGRDYFGFGIREDFLRRRYLKLSLEGWIGYGLGKKGIFGKGKGVSKGLEVGREGRMGEL